MAPYKYLLISSLCLSIAYAFFRLLYKKEANFRQLRFILLSTIVLSLIIPLSNYSMEVSLRDKQSRIANTLPHNTDETKFDKQTALAIQNPASIEPGKESNSQHNINWLQIIKAIYLLVSLSLIARLGIRIILLLIQYLKSEKIKLDRTTLVINSSFNNAFSFFGWIFINPEILSKEDYDQMISHEKVHASQYHSFDLLLIELLAAAMWFNPFVWMMRNSIQQVHEYLADEGALSTGIDKHRYQALLINQVSEERLIFLSSNFNPADRPGRQSLIKKRMIMMNKKVNNSGSKLKVLALIPIAAILFFAAACVNKTENKQVVAAISPVRMNVMYLGLDNPVKIAVSGYEVSEIEATVENGKIFGENGEYIVRPMRPGTLIVTVSANGEVIQSSEFRVKNVPDPVVALRIKNKFRRSGRISKSDLLSAGEPVLFMENFDFDLYFEITSFVLSSQLPGKFIVREEISENGKFSALQLDLLNSLVVNQKLTVEEIIATGPDGTNRNMGSMVFTISEE